jgi:hypothetical protein
MTASSGEADRLVELRRVAAADGVDERRLGSGGA